MDTKLYNQTGEVIGKVALEAKVFGVKPSRGLIEQAIVTQQANARVAISHTKTKGEVRGGGKKPWKQKGTGRARHGSIRSPQWKGGGIVHGPRSNRNYSLKMNVQAKRKALLMSLSDKAMADRLVVVDKIALDKAKTKAFATVMSKLPKQKSSLVILPSTDQTLIRAGRNIPGVTFIRADSLNVLDVVKHQQLVVLQPALEKMTAVYGK